jgi:type I restriction enzyme, S subunit
MNQFLDEKLSINKNDWIKVSFGDVVLEPKESVKDPVAEGVEHVVGLEHIDSEDIHLRRYAGIEESTTFTKKFRKGDVLFGRRRAYLKKAAQADFEGICSGDITVMRAKENLMSELLPFIVNNEKFFDYAITHSAGGLSPRVKFKYLADYELLLPPIEQQAKLAELLWAIDCVVQANIESALKFKIFYQRYLYDSVSGKISSNSKEWKNYLFGELGQSYGGLSGKTKKDFGVGKPFITYMNIFNNSRINVSTIDYVDIQPHEKQNEVSYGDILITGSSETPEELGMSSVVLDNLVDHYLNSFCFGFRLNNFNILLPEYARFLMRGGQVRSFMFKHAQGSTRFNLSKTTLKEKLRLKIPTIKEQKIISDNLDRIDQVLEQFESKIRSSKILQSALINKVFSHGIYRVK